MFGEKVACRVQKKGIPALVQKRLSSAVLLLVALGLKLSVNPMEGLPAKLRDAEKIVLPETARAFPGAGPILVAPGDAD
jgi:hypothetical protein